MVILSSNNLLVLNSEITGMTTAPLILKTRELNRSLDNSPLYLFMNTPGGEIQAGLEFIEALKGSDRPINTITLFSASMGFQIVQSLGERLILNKGTLMSHRAKGGVEGTMGGKKPSQLDNRYNFWLNLLFEMDKQTVDRTNGKQTLESYQNAYADELWLSGNQSVVNGYADRIVSVQCDETLAGVTPRSVDFMGLTITYELDNCPINTGPMNVKVELPVTSKSNKLKETKIDLNKFVSLNGGFGPSCPYSNTHDICASDPTITPKDINMAVEQFKDTMTNKKNHVVKMAF